MNKQEEKPIEVPVPGKSPEIIPGKDPLPNEPGQHPEVTPGIEPLSIPPSAPQEVPDYRFHDTTSITLT